MRLLPTESKKRVAQAIELLERIGSLTVREPCDCDGQIRHNNGGNYHEIAEFVHDDGAWFKRLGSTSEYDNAEWEQTTYEEVCEYVNTHADWL